MELEQLIEECRNKSAKAQQMIYDLYAKKMFITCRRYLKNDLMAEEAVMNGFLKFFSSINTFEYRNEEYTEAWLRRLMVNICLKQLDKSIMMMISIEEIPETASDDDVLSRVSEKEIYAAITQLPIGCRTIFNLFYMDDMGHDEIAATLKISVSTSKSQLGRARQLLQDLLIKNCKEYESRKRK